MPDQSQPSIALLPFQPATMTPAQLAAVSFLARYIGPTHHLYAYQLRRWFAWCEDNGLDALLGIDRAHIELYIRHLGETGLMASSINIMMRGVRGYFRFAHIDGVTPSDPAVYARLPEVHRDESRTQGLDRLELIRFLQVAQTITVHHNALAYLLGINALRASEAAAVRIEGLRRDTARASRPASCRQGQQARHDADHCPSPARTGSLSRRTDQRSTDPATVDWQPDRPARRLPHGPAHRPRRGDPQTHQSALSSTRSYHQRARRRRPATRRTDPGPSCRPPNHRALRPSPRQP